MSRYILWYNNSCCSVFFIIDPYNCLYHILLLGRVYWTMGTLWYFLYGIKYPIKGLPWGTPLLYSKRIQSQDYNQNSEKFTYCWSGESSSMIQNSFQRILFDNWFTNHKKEILIEPVKSVKQYSTRFVKCVPTHKPLTNCALPLITINSSISNILKVPEKLSLTQTRITDFKHTQKLWKKVATLMTINESFLFAAVLWMLYVWLTPGRSFQRNDYDWLRAREIGHNNNNNSFILIHTTRRLQIRYAVVSYISYIQ